MNQYISSPIGIGILILIAVGISVYFMNYARGQGEIINEANVVRMQTYQGAIFKTNKGDIEIALFESDAPKTVANFTKLAEEGFYNGTKFHRVISDFMIQGGDPLSKQEDMKERWGTGGPGYTFEDEINEHKIVRGALAMANAGPGTNGSQFFILTANAAPWLDGKHTVFGEVVSGMDVVDAIEATETDAQDRPLETIVVEEVVLK